MDKRLSTALLAVRDTLLAIFLAAPLALLLRFFVLPDQVTGAPGSAERAAQVLETVGWILPALLAASSLGFLAMGWWFRRKRPVEGWEREGPRRLSPARAAATGFFVGLGALLATVAVGLLTAALFGVEAVEHPIIRALAATTGLTWLAFLVAVTVIGPIGEELFFRGYLFRWSASRCGLAYAYGLTSILFAVGHGNPRGIPSYLVAGLIFAWAYERSRSLVVPIVAHATMNGIVTLVFALASRALIDT